MEFYARIAHKSWWHETWMWALPLEWRRCVPMSVSVSVTVAHSPVPKEAAGAGEGVDVGGGSP